MVEDQRAGGCPVDFPVVGANADARLRFTGGRLAVVLEVGASGCDGDEEEVC